jgi:flagellar motor switch protein FliG
LGPTPLSDVETAQQELVQLAERLDAEGHIDLPHAMRLSAA